MSGRTYIYGGNRAAEYLLANSSLSYITASEKVFYAGDDCLRVDLETPRPSEGERLLWEALDSLARQAGSVDVMACAQFLDTDNLRVLWDALGMRFGFITAATATEGVTP